MELSGILKHVSKTEEIGTKGFVKRDFVITTEEQYPQHISIQLVQDKVDLIDSYSIGDKLKVSINLRGREWTNPQGEIKYFNTIQAWRIQALVANQPTHVPEPIQHGPEVTNNTSGSFTTEENHNDLPFEFTNQ